MKTNRTSTPATKTKSRTPGRILSASIAVLLAVIALPDSANAATLTWNGSASVTQASTGWSNIAFSNWVGGAEPVSGDDLAFDPNVVSQDHTVNNNDLLGKNFNSITFLSLGAFVYTLNGNAITLGAGGLTNNTAGVTQTVSLASLTLGAGQTWNANAGNLAVTSPVGLNGNGLIVTGANNTTISGSISGVGVDSTLTKNGPGILTLSGMATNSFAGLTTVNDGRLDLDKDLNDAAIVGNLTIGDGVGAAASAEVRWLQGGEVANTSAIIINSDGKMNLNSFSDGVGSISGVAGAEIEMGGGTLATGFNNTSTTFAGVISGLGNLFKTGTGTWTLTGANNYSSTTTVDEGILEAGHASALGTTPTGTEVRDGATLRLLNNVNIGAEEVNLKGAGADAANGALAVAAGGTASYAGLIRLLESSTITANGGALTLTGGIVKNGTTLTLGTATAGGGTINVNSVISGAAASSDLVVESLTTNLNAANTYNGPTFIRSSGGAGTGILNANVAGALPDPAFGALARSALTMDDSGAGSSVLNLNDGFGQVVASLTGAASSIVDLDTSILTIGNSLGGPDTTFAGTINGLAGPGNVSIIKDGTSTQVFSGPNTYLGLTNVDEGTLRLGNASALGSTGSGTNVDFGATLDLFGQNIGVEAININALGVAAGIGALTNSSGTAASLAGILTVVTPSDVGGAGDISLDGKVTGDVLTKVGAGTVFLTNNANDYVNTQITTGTLQVGGSTAGGTAEGALGSGVVTNNATLNFNRNNALVVANAISGTGAVNQNGTGTTNVSGTNSYLGLTTVNAGVLEVQNNTALGGDGAGAAASGTVVNDGATLRLANDTVVGNETLTINGVGTGVADAQGALTVTAGGSATYNGSISLGSNSTIHANAGTLIFNQVIIKTNSILTLTGGGIINVNGGISGDDDNLFNDDLIVHGSTVNMNNANTYEGPTAIRSVVAGDGILNANVANAMPTVNGRSAVTMDDSGAGGSTLNIGGSVGFLLGADQAIASLAGAATSKVTLGNKKLTIGFGTAPNTNGTAAANFAGVISGTGNIIKDDNSTQIFGGANTYTGVTNVKGGTLQAGFLDTAFGVDSSVRLALEGTLQLANFSETIGSLAGDGKVQNTVSDGPGDAVLTISGKAGNTAAYAGVISDTAGTPLALVLNDGSAGGTTVESFSGQSTYRAGTTLNAGRLDIDATSVAAGAIPAVNPVASGPVGTGTLTIEGGTIGTSTVTNSNHAIGNTVQVQGDFKVAGNNGSNDGVSFTGTVNLVGPTRITTDSGFLNLTGTVEGAGGLTLAGSDTFTYIGSAGVGGIPDILGQVDASNTYGDLTTVSGGLVVLGKNSGAFAIPGNLQVDDGATVQFDSAAVVAPNAPGLVTTANQINPTSSVLVNGKLDISGINQTVAALTGGGTVKLDDSGGANDGAAGDFTVDSGNFTGAIVDAGAGGRLIKASSGNLILSGASTYTGSTNVVAGNLIVNGSLTSNVFVQLGAALAGIGSTTRNVVNGGTFSPGTGGSLSVGKFNAGGNYTQTAGGTLVIDIAGHFPGQSDLVAVNGTANLDGTLRLVNGGGTKLKVGDKVTFLTAKGGVNGEFADEINPFSTADTIVTTEVVYHANYVSLEARQGSFAEFGLHCSPNGQAVGRALDKLVASGRNEKLINLLNGVQLTDLCQDLDLIAPEELQALYTVGISQANVQTANLSRRMDDLRSGAGGFSASGYSVSGMEPQSTANYLAANQGLAGPQGKMSKDLCPPVDNTVGFFATGSGEFTDIGSTNNARGYNLSSAGFTLGMDYRVNENFAIGVNLGYSRTKADIAGGGKINTDGLKLGLYATYFRDGFYVDGSVQGGYNTYDTRRAALRGSATGSTDGTDFNAHLAFGYDWRRGGLTVGPTASLQYTRVGFDSFSESGSQAALTYSSQSADSLRSALGMKAAYAIHAGSVIIKPEVRAAWQHEFGDSAYGLQSQISKGGAGFNVRGAKIGADSLLLGAGVAVLWNERIATYVYYDGELGRSNYQSNNVSVGVRLEF